MRVQSLMRHSYFRTGALGRTQPPPVQAVERAQPVQKPFAINPSNRQQQRIEGVASRVLWNLKWIREQTKKPLVFGRSKTRTLDTLNQDDEAPPAAEISAKGNSHDHTQHQGSSLLESTALAIQWANASTEHGLAAALPDQPEEPQTQTQPNPNVPVRTASQPADAQAARLISGFKTLKAHARFVANPTLFDAVESKLHPSAVSDYRETIASFSAMRPLVAAAA
jgi:hypothetical protein